MPELVRIPFQTGKCTRCGKQVTRGNPGERWRDQFGRDRCRASYDDDQCEVVVVSDEQRLAVLATMEIMTVTLSAADGRPLLVQDLPQGMDWSENLSAVVTEDPVASISVTHRQVQYRAQYDPGEEETP